MIEYIIEKSENGKIIESCPLTLDEYVCLKATLRDVKRNKQEKKDFKYFP